MEQASKDGCRVWWTDEDVARAAGALQPPPEAELDLMRCVEPHPFVRWCHGRYIEAVGGVALLSHPPCDGLNSDPSDRYAPGFVEASFFRKRFPRLAVVTTVKQWD